MKFFKKLVGFIMVGVVMAMLMWFGWIIWAFIPRWKPIAADEAQSKIREVLSQFSEVQLSPNDKIEGTVHAQFPHSSWFYRIDATSEELGQLKQAMLNRPNCPQNLGLANFPCATSPSQSLGIQLSAGQSAPAWWDRQVLLRSQYLQFANFSGLYLDPQGSIYVFWN